MRTITLLILSAILSYQLNARSFFATISAPAHQFCIKNVPKVDRDIHSALVCGENRLRSSVRKLLSTTGLIHLLVVSGSHLVVLMELLALISMPHVLRLIILCAFVLMTGFQPPCVRSLVQLCLRFLNRLYHWHWSPVELTVRAAIITLVLVPQWLTSWSFQLSLAASLALAMTSQTTAKPIRTQLLIALFVAPLLLGNTLAPVCVFANVILGPLLGLILFPLAALDFFIPVFIPVFHSIWSILTVVLEEAAHTTTIQTAKPLGFIGTLYVLFLTVLASRWSRNQC